MGVLKYVPQAQLDKLQHSNLKVGSSCEVSDYYLKEYANIIWEGMGPAGFGFIKEEKGEGDEREFRVKYFFNDGIASKAIREFWIPAYKVDVQFSLIWLYFIGTLNYIWRKITFKKGPANTNY